MEVEPEDDEGGPAGSWGKPAPYNSGRDEPRRFPRFTGRDAAMEVSIANNKRRAALFAKSLNTGQFTGEEY